MTAEVTLPRESSEGVAYGTFQQEHIYCVSWAPLKKWENSWES